MKNLQTSPWYTHYIPETGTLAHGLLKIYNTLYRRVRVAVGEGHSDVVNVLANSQTRRVCRDDIEEAFALVGGANLTLARHCGALLDGW